MVLVSHCDLIKAALLRLLGLPLDDYPPSRSSPASISALVMATGAPKVLGMNEAIAA